MVSIRRILTVFTAAAAMMMLSTVILAQDTTDKSDAERVERKQRAEKRARREGFRGMKRHHRKGGMIRGLRNLDLTESQQSQIKTLMETHQMTNKPAMDELRTLMAKRRDGTFTDADKARVQDIRASMKASGDQLKATIMGLLTPEQTQKLEQMKAEREERMELRRERMKQRKKEMEERRRQKSEAPPADTN
ncbi:MAG: hypothetical protein DWQ47_13515 [Acidobacteria bacterium]|nr:MAG: hypothetical protein DWQ32_00915 [Acidobacteriota bacterium]REK02908.1 MAG: hypothetical protein DWQ38_11220 [Acidobacteriota bacterium]REK13288.1 MAG: hypothetical protein DWQ43_06605 [Acidobacteriota bacterium]REK41282.1 MAG: hypothetical protein DWQ47_13515 [Acidobacteriota bacterium]